MRSGQRSGGSCPLSAKNTGNVAPGFTAEAERLALDMLVSGRSAAAVAKQLSALDRRTEAEAVLRLVEFGTGPLGLVRAARGDPGVAVGADALLPQAPVLGLAAQASDGRLQRLGDRIYLDGREIQIPALVRLARDGGVRIRYPGLDPMDAAMSGGPSVRRRQPRGGGAAVTAALPGGRA